MNIEEQPPHRGLSTLRAVVLTLVAVGVLAGAGIGAFFLYSAFDDQRAKARAARADAQAARGDVAQLRARVARLKRDVSAANRRAGDNYVKGLNDARKNAEEFGLDYIGGYNDAFEGFGGWQLDSWYIVLIAQGEGKQKYDIKSRISLEPCRGYQLIGDSIFTHTDSC